MRRKRERKKMEEYLFCVFRQILSRFDSPVEGGGWRGKRKTSKAPPVK